MQHSTYRFVVAIAIVSWPAGARLVRGAVMSLRTREYVPGGDCDRPDQLGIIWREF